MGTTGNSDQVESEDTCVICLSPVTLRAVAVPCNHLTFDFICLLSWLQEQSTCPLCTMHLLLSYLTAASDQFTGKAQVTAIQYDWRSPEDFKTYNIPRKHKHQDDVSPNTTEWPSIFVPYGLPRRPRDTRRPYSPPVEDTALLRRREVYQRKLYSQHIGSNPYSGYRDISPQMIAGSSDLQTRARTWIRRELRVFSFLHHGSECSTSRDGRSTGNIEFLLSYIVSILKIVDIKASNGHAENLLTEFLGRENAKLFLHELNAWLRSPYTKVEEWDENVQYVEDE